MAHLDSVNNLSGDLSSDDSDDSRDSRGLGIESSDANVLDINILSTVNEPNNEPDAPHINITVNESDAPCINITQDTWSGCHAQVDDYVDSNTEDEDYEDDQPCWTDLSEEDFDFDFQEEGIGMCNGLGTDDLIDKDFQQIITEFCVLNSLSGYSAYSENTTIQQKSFQRMILIFCIHFCWRLKKASQRKPRPRSCLPTTATI